MPYLSFKISDLAEICSESEDNIDSDSDFICRDSGDFFVYLQQIYIVHSMRKITYGYYICLS